MIKSVAFKSRQPRREDRHQHVLDVRVAAGNLAQLHFVVAHQEVDAVLGSILHLGQLFRNAAENDVF